MSGDSIPANDTSTGGSPESPNGDAMGLKHLFAYHGKGRCAGSTAFALGESETEARARLLRDDACKFFEIEFGEMVTLLPSEAETTKLFFENYLEKS